jgi:hypothetical protein
LGKEFYLNTLAFAIRFLIISREASHNKDRAVERKALRMLVIILPPKSFDISGKGTISKNTTEVKRSRLIQEKVTRRMMYVKLFNNFTS